MRLGDKRPHARIGGKASGLEWLIANNLQTPPAWTIPPGFVDGLERIIEPGKRYAVRSSANVEDGVTASFAGQFLTVLDASGLKGVRKAIDEVRGSINSEAVRSYAAKVGDKALITMPVIVQEMVNPVASGVAFTRNPITGLNEVILEAVSGRGDRLVSVGATPHRWVRRWGLWTESPDDPPISDDVAAEIAAAATRIASIYGRPVDIEWVWDGSQVWWLQIRPITGIGVGDVGIYSNRIAREVVPGLLKPLVAAVNMPLINRAWNEMFLEAAGKSDARPRELAKLFARRPYFSMRAIGDMMELIGLPRDSLESLIGMPEGPEQPTFKPSAATLLKSPRLAAFALGRSRRNKRIEGGLDAVRDGYAVFDVELDEKSDAELLSAVDGLMDIATVSAYANIVDPLLANIYTALLPRKVRGSDRGSGGEASPATGDELTPETDPKPHLDHLAATVAASDRESDAAQEELRTFVSRFGHLSTPGNDFSVATWGEDPNLVLDIAEAGGATELGFSNPWARVSAELGTRGRLVANPLRKRAAGYENRQDQVWAVNAAGHRLFRKYFLELGRRLVAGDVIDAAADVMYLSLDQVRDSVDGSLEEGEARHIVSGQKGELEFAATLDVPSLIYGEDFIAPSGSSRRGVATSRGHHRGPLKVVIAEEDFDKVQAGDVLAIRASDVGWTPLFAKAAAVISEAGGMLSNSSIIAREFGLPCIVGVAGITDLNDGTVVTVDGYRGEVALG
ncbi:MAG: hypothetical protein GY720_07970 [bacterium]|nr:hypothetical protein [bacterium]